MSARRPPVVAVVATVAAVLLWWLARELVVIAAPTLDPSAKGEPVPHTVVDPWLLLGAVLAAGVAMVATTLAALRAGAARGR